MLHKMFFFIKMKFSQWKKTIKYYHLKLYLKSHNIDIKNKNLNLQGEVIIEISKSTKFTIGSNVTLSNCSIYMSDNSELAIGDNSILKGVTIYLEKTSIFQVHKQVLIEQINPFPQNIHLINASIEIGQASRIRCSILAQNGGKVTIGQKTFINQGTQIRCDRSVLIGDYTLISYEVDIFDTNTHCTDWRERRHAITQSPLHTILGEPSPISKPIVIGNDCWIGKRAAILKGVTLGDKTIVGLGAIVTSSIPEESIAYGNPAKWKNQSHSIN